VTGPGRGCRRDGWPGPLRPTHEQHKSGSGRRPTREQHGRNGIPRHTLARVLKLLCQPNYQDGCALAGLTDQDSPGGIGRDRPSENCLGGLALSGQAQGERIDLGLEDPSVQLFGLPGTRSWCGHGRSSPPAAHHPHPALPHATDRQALTGQEMTLETVPAARTGPRNETRISAD